MKLYAHPLATFAPGCEFAAPFFESRRCGLVAPLGGLWCFGCFLCGANELFSCCVALGHAPCCKMTPRHHADPHPQIGIVARASFFKLSGQPCAVCLVFCTCAFQTPLFTPRMRPASFFFFCDLCHVVLPRIMLGCC